MKKRLLSALLALCMVLTLLPAAFAAGSGSGYRDSGSTTMTKLTKLEIARLLKENPLTLPDNVFETEPSYASPYAPGKVKQEALQAALDRLNALRRIAGLPSVALDSEWCSKAQYGAVLLSVSEFSHYPSQPADMDSSFYSIGRSATSTSNIYGGVTLTRAVDGFMDDSDSSNVDRLGHRRWQLNPSMSKVGFGYAAHGYYRQYVDEKVFEGYSSGGRCDYDFIAWPASGNFPNTLFGKNVAWSVTVDPNRYQTPVKSAITVTLTCQNDGTSWTFSGSQNYTAASTGAYFNVETSNYGVNNCIIFRPNGVSKYEGVYTVTITGLRARNGAAATLSYQVDFFDPEHPLPFPDVQPDDYHADAVVWAVEKGFITGYDDGMFHPSINLTSGMLVTLLARLDGVDTRGGSVWYGKGAEWARAKGVYDVTDPEDDATREQMVTMLWRYAGRPSADTSILANYPDSSGIHDWPDFREAMAWAVGTGLVKGDGVHLMPLTTTDRGQAVTLFLRYYDMLGRK